MQSPPLTNRQLRQLREMWLDGVPSPIIMRTFRCSFARLHFLVRLVGLSVNRERVAYLPTPEVIEREAAAIKAKWSEEEMLRRHRTITDPLPPDFDED